MIPVAAHYFLRILLYGGMQIFFLKNLALFHVAFCFVYVYFTLQFHSSTPPLQLLLLSFLLGLFVDLFYDYLGLHAAALVALAFARQYWLRRIVPAGNSDGGFVPDIATHGLLWFVTYALPLIFLHHLVLFFAEMGGFQLFWRTLLKAAASSVFTLTGVIVVQYLLPKRKRL